MHAPKNTKIAPQVKGQSDTCHKNLASSTVHHNSHSYQVTLISEEWFFSLGSHCVAQNKLQNFCRTFQYQKSIFQDPVVVPSNV